MNQKKPKPTKFKKLSRQNYVVHDNGKPREFGNRHSARAHYREILRRKPQ